MTKTLAMATTLLLVATSAAIAQPPPQDPDWPCAQRLVAKLEPGSYWDGPPIPDAAGWRDNEPVAAVVTDVIDRDTSNDDAQTKLKSYVDSLPADQRAKSTPPLFAALVDQTNDQRSILIGRIEQLSRRQHALADTISNLNAKADAAPPDKREDINGQRDLTIRAFQEVQRTMRYACEAPANMDRRLGLLAKTLSSYK